MTGRSDGFFIKIATPSMLAQLHAIDVEVWHGNGGHVRVHAKADRAFPAR